METLQIIDKAIRTQLCKKITIANIINQKNAAQLKGFRNTKATPKKLLLAIEIVYEGYPIWIVFSKGFAERPYLFISSQEKHNYIERECKNYYTGVLRYKFKATRQDNLNEQRKKKFQSVYRSNEVKIPFPVNIHEVQPFLISLHRLAKASIIAMDFLDIEKSEIENQKCFYTPEHDLISEGGKIKILSTKYERNLKNRQAAIEFHGATCKACGFNFEEYYGPQRKSFIEVHHIIPLSSLRAKMPINPETDLIPLCSNCHRMIHMIPDYINGLEILKKSIQKTRNSIFKKYGTYSWLT